MNRRNFIGALSGLLAWVKSGFSLSPASSSIQPTCKDPNRYEIRFIAQDGHISEPFPVAHMDSNTITVAGPFESKVGDYLMVSSVPIVRPVMVYHQIEDANRILYRGLKRA